MNPEFEQAPISERRHFALVRPYEQIPRNVISEIEINHEMAEQVTDPNLLKWFNPDYLQKRAAIFGFGNYEGSLYRLQTPSSNRSVYLQKDSLFFDEFNNAYGAISAKGTGTHTNFGINDPAGLFGATHAEAEQEVSQRLAQEGARVGRVIGRIVLDPDSFGKWLNASNKNSKYSPVNELNKVIFYNDTPAIVVRLEGADRVTDLHNKNYYSEARTFGRTARLHLKEIEKRGGIDSYLEHYQLPELPNLIYNLSLLSPLAGRGNDYRPCLSLEEVSEIVFLFHYFYRMNHLKSRKVSERYYNGKLTIKNDAQDLDAAGYWYDFETSTPERSQYHSNNPATGEKINLPYIWSGDRIRVIAEEAGELANNNFRENYFQFK